MGHSCPDKPENSRFSAFLSPFRAILHRTKKRAARRPFLAVTPSSSHVFTRQPISCQSSTILPYQLNQIKASLNQN
nr:MAG TPA: hypothetical protein [Caudoviricetes sp.]